MNKELVNYISFSSYCKVLKGVHTNDVGNCIVASIALLWSQYKFVLSIKATYT